MGFDIGSCIVQKGDMKVWEIQSWGELEVNLVEKQLSTAKGNPLQQDVMRAELLNGSWQLRKEQSECMVTPFVDIADPTDHFDFQCAMWKGMCKAAQRWRRLCLSTPGLQFVESTSGGRTAQGG